MLSAAAVWTTLSVSLAAQENTAVALFGTVVDSSGAAVAHATVTATPRLATDATRKIVTGSDGTFSFHGLGTGEFTVSVSAAGFSMAARTVLYSGVALGLTLHVVPGGDRSEITVTADGALPDASAPAHVNVTIEEIHRIASTSASSPMSSLITSTAPGVAADSNGSFHPLGDHAEASFVIDGQPITDQQSRTFSSQISLNALQSVEVREGAPQVDVGDKTSMVIVAQTRSGLGQRRAAGEAYVARGTFSTSQASAHVSYGTDRFGTFSAVDALNSGRFLDTPERAPLHSNGNAENVLERLDYKPTGRTTLQLNLGGSHAWFQTPNTYDQQAKGQDQRQTIQSFNAAPSLLHTFSAAAFLQSNFWVRQDKVRYRPSANALADTPATLAQSRRLTSAGTRSTYGYAQGRHTVMAGAEWKHTFLAERFSTGLTDAGYNSPCLQTDGAASQDTSLRATGQCAGAGLDTNPDFLPNLLALDLTRGGRLFSFSGGTDIKQEALYGQDTIRLGKLTANLGLRLDVYNGITARKALQPRVGLGYTVEPFKTVLRANYSRVFLTPYNENLIVASSAGPGSTATSLGATGFALRPGHRNQFNVGFETQLFTHFIASGEYFWKFTYGAYDFDVLLNSPLTFPTQFRKSKIDGGLLRLSVLPVHGFAGYFTASHVRSRLFGPETGGVSFSAPYSDVVRPDHDQDLATNGYLRYQFRKTGPWFAFSWRYDGGLVSVATPDFSAVLRLSGDEQAQLGLLCGTTAATVAAPVRTCPRESLRTLRVRIPAAGTEDDDRNPSRIVPRHVFNVSIGKDAVVRHERQEVGFHIDAVNVSDNDGLYTFLSTFSGTHFLAPRSVTVQLRYAF